MEKHKEYINHDLSPKKHYKEKPRKVTPYVPTTSVKQKAENKCVLCGTDKALYVHHVNGNRKDNELKNLMAICASCHQGLHRDPQGQYFMRKREILELREAGLKLHEIASIYNLSKQRIHQIIKQGLIGQSVLD